MFGAQIMAGGARNLALAAVSALTLASATGTSLAADRGGWSHGGDRGGHGGGDVRFSIRDGGFGFGFSERGRFGFGVSLNLGNDYWRQPYYCPSPVVYRPYCPPVYYYRPYSTVAYSSPSVVYTQPVVVEQQPQVVVQQQQPTYTSAPTPVVYQQPQPQPTMVTSAPAAQQAPETGRYQDRDLGDSYLRIADFSNASRVYQRYLTAWNGDGTVTRNLGFSLIGRGEVQDGFRAVIQGYKLEPGLFDRPMRVTDLGGQFGFQSLLDAASRGASGTNTAEGWFTLAMLNHTAGNRDAAINALQRSRDAGLETTLLDAAMLRVNAATR